jgi:hypothetical protein
MIHLQNITFNSVSLDRHYEHVQNRKSRTTRYQVMLNYLITDTVTDVLECVPIRTLLAFVRTSTLHGRIWRVLEKIFAVF